MVVPSRTSLRWLVPPILMLSGCMSSPPPNPPPEAPSPPPGWSSVGATQGETAPEWAFSRLRFSGRHVAVHASCMGSGKVFVIVDWKSVSTSEGPGAFPTAVFPCGSPIEGELTTRIELSADPSGDAEVAVFALDGADALSPTRFGVSIEQRDP